LLVAAARRPWLVAVVVAAAGPNERMVRLDAGELVVEAVVVSSARFGSTRAPAAWSTSAPLSRACRPPLACDSAQSAAAGELGPPPSPRTCR
jgi:hypothetical protein